MPKATNGTAVSEPRAMSPMMMPRSRKLDWMPSSVRWWTPATSIAPARPAEAARDDHRHDRDPTGADAVEPGRALVEADGAQLEAGDAALGHDRGDDRDEHDEEDAGVHRRPAEPGRTAPSPTGSVTAPPAPGSDQTTDGEVVEDLERHEVEQHRREDLVDLEATP